MRNRLLSVCLFSFCLAGVAQAATFKGDCLEMRCAYKCSENAEGVGKCCKKPTKQSCKQGTKDSFGCVITEKITCPADKPICQEDGTCGGCSSSSECPSLKTFCLNGQCVPCNQEGTGIRPSRDAEHCDCPVGFTRKCDSIYTTVNCADGGSWRCVPGCFDHTDCRTDHYCSCNGTGCHASGGSCRPCPDGTHRSQDSVSECLPCSVCEDWDRRKRECVPVCGTNAMCMQAPGYEFGYKGCGGDYCMALPDASQLVRLEGTLNGQIYYLPPAEDTYKMTQTSASRFCEAYGMHLATVTEACLKDYAYDTGGDCPNITENRGAEYLTHVRSFTDRGTDYSLASWGVDGLGSFWLANKDGATTALRVTYSCGNNHSTYVCERFYPLCTTK